MYQENGHSSPECPPNAMASEPNHGAFSDPQAILFQEEIDEFVRECSGAGAAALIARSEQGIQVDFEVQKADKEE